MLTLSNGATVLAAFILPRGDGMKPHGLVLASQPYLPRPQVKSQVEYITWEIHWDGATTDPNAGITHEVWECESGHYFQPSLVNNRDTAEYDFGLRLNRLLTQKVFQGTTGMRIG